MDNEQSIILEQRLLFARSNRLRTRGGLDPCQTFPVDYAVGTFLVPEYLDKRDESLNTTLNPTVLPCLPK